MRRQNGEATRAAVPELRCRAIDRVQVKGKEQAVKIYEPFASPLGEEDRARIEAWERALAVYAERRFAEAAAMFRALAEDSRDAKLCALYRSRCARFDAHPPPVDWDRVTVATAGSTVE